MMNARGIRIVNYLVEYPQLFNDEGLPVNFAKGSFLAVGMQLDFSNKLWSLDQSQGCTVTRMHACFSNASFLSIVLT